MISPAWWNLQLMKVTNTARTKLPGITWLATRMIRLLPDVGSSCSTQLEPQTMVTVERPAVVSQRHQYLDRDAGGIRLARVAPARRQAAVAAARPAERTQVLSHESSSICEPRA